MISVTEAKKIIADNVVPLTPQKQSLYDASYKILAKDVYASFDIPAFAQSAVDGYAFSFSDCEMNKKLVIKGESSAGINKEIEVTKGSAVRIFTGAPVPHGVDTVVMQEKVKAEDNNLLIEDENITQGANVRPVGSEIKAGQLALTSGSLLSAAAIGFLAGIGVTEVEVYPDPVITIIVTGNELQSPGEVLQYGQVYESNSASLKAALKKININHIEVYKAEDKLETVVNVLDKAITSSDVVLLTGGVSVGDYDFVLEAAERCGITQVFHKVKQRPGKPLYFGKKESKLVFGLPGNPSSVLTCFYEYVMLAIELLTRRQAFITIIKAPLLKSFNKAIKLTQFYKGHYNGENATLLDAQESYRLHSFARANCLVKIDEDTTSCTAGELVEVHILPV